jgi:integrase
MPQSTKGGLRPTRQLFREPTCSANETLTQYMIHLQKQAYMEQTIRTKYKILRVMIKDNVNLNDPEAVKLYIAKKHTWSNGHKIIAVYTYNEYAKMKNIQWTPPQYKRDETLPFIPTEKEIEALINGTGNKTSTALQTLKETGFRIGELWNCKWTDIDEEKNTLKCKAEKHGKPRETRISVKLISRLNALPKTNDYLFGKTSLSGFRWTYDKQKTLLAQKLQNPRLKQIHFHTLRHHYATKLYNETKNILEVQAKLGHRRIESTMVYTHIVEFDEESQNYHHATAKDEKQAGELIDNGWTYILTTPQSTMMFRKRK